MYAPHSGSKLFQFHVVFGKFWQNRMPPPPPGLAPPRWGIPGSAVELCTNCTKDDHHSMSGSSESSQAADRNLQTLSQK